MKTLNDDLLLEIFHKQTGALSFDACFKRGFEAAQNNEQETDNPFKANTKEAKFWADGWWDGFYDVPTQERHSDDACQERRHPDDAITQDRHPDDAITQDRHPDDATTQDRHPDDATTQDRHPDDAKHPSGSIMQGITKMDTNDSHSSEGGKLIQVGNDNNMSSQAPRTWDPRQENSKPIKAIDSRSEQSTDQIRNEKQKPHSKWIAFAATAVAVSVIAVNFVDFAA